MPSVTASSRNRTNRRQGKIPARAATIRATTCLVATDPDSAAASPPDIPPANPLSGQPTNLNTRMMTSVKTGMKNNGEISINRRSVLSAS